MKDLKVVEKLNYVESWLTNNQDFLINYLIDIISAIIILIIGTILSRVISQTLNNVMKVHHTDTTIADFVSAILRYGVITFSLIAALNRIGVQTTSVIAVIGAAGLAIGLALQDSLSNFAAGVLLVTFRYFHIGDYVDFRGISGTVLIVQIFSTTLRTYDGKIIVIPNRKIISGNIINFSKDPNQLIDTIISVSYDADINIVKKIITEILINDARIIQDKGIIVRLNSFSAISMDFIIRAWVPRGDKQSATFDLLEKAKILFDKNNIKTSCQQINICINCNHKPYLKQMVNPNLTTDNLCSNLNQQNSDTKTKDYNTKNN